MSASNLMPLLDRAIRAMWPRRAQQELLLDLGERKGWNGTDYEAALASACTWLSDELGLGTAGTIAEVPAAPVSLVTVRQIANDLPQDGPSSGVAKWAEAIAPAVGSTPKTLANSLTRGLRPERADHRWLLSLAQAAGEAPTAGVDAWLYHRRSPASVSLALGSLGTGDQYAAGDALLVFSLLALWQRRRPTHAARANKGRPRSRRETPKPVAALTSSLASPGQLPHLLRLARALTGGREFALLGLEAALTEAHLAPHAPRRTGGRDTWDGETWLRVVEAALTEFIDVVGKDDAAVFAFRVERMRAWRESRPLCPLGELPRVPYVEASLALEARRAGASLSATYSAQTPGLLMLLPLLRSRGFEVHP